MNQKTILYSVITVVAIVLAYFLFSTPDKKIQDKDTSGISSSKTPSKSFMDGREALRYETEKDSLFNEKNQFLDFSGIEKEEMNSDLANNSPNGDISPEEKERRRKLVIEKYKDLAKAFPNNRYIPREYSSEEQEAIQRRDANMNYLQERILSGDELSPTETAYFYSNKLEETKEKKEIIEYSMEKLMERGNLGEDAKKIIQERIQSIDSRGEVFSKELLAAKEKGGNPADFDSVE